jgi:hypothetical protein
MIYTLINDGQIVKFDGKVTTVFSQETSPSLYAEFESWLAEGNEAETVEPLLIPAPEETE